MSIKYLIRLSECSFAHKKFQVGADTYKLVNITVSNCTMDKLPNML